MKRFVDFGKKFDERRKRTSSVEFLKNITLNGLFGSSNPEKCHHPIKITTPIFIKRKRYFIQKCRDCGKPFSIYGPR
jgi:prepilin signal peptidase PulO-like enzyme (type II secretory pathway)